MNHRVYTRKDKLKCLIKAIEKVYPPQLADSWDNTGLILDCADDEVPASQELRVFLTIDLTPEVLDEAIDRRADIIISYHPVIFHGVKKLTIHEARQGTIMKLIRKKISVYSLHTAADAVPGGVNDWLARAVAFGPDNILVSSTLKPATVVPGFEGAGYGRLITLREPQPLSTLVEHVRRRLRLKIVPVVQSTKHKTEPITTIALCPGSGAKVLDGVKADLIVTGELTHHEQLHLREAGISAFITGHWCSEAGFLGVVAERLARELASQGARAPNAKLIVSTADQSPLQFM